MIKKELIPYVKMLSNFLDNSIDALQFEKVFFKYFKNDSTHWSETEFLILDRLFAEVDAFCPDPKLRGKDDIDEDQLREQCRTALEKLNKL